MLTIKSIAKKFAISPGAVSKALNGMPGVSEKLRGEIARYARENNYIPNAYARGLKGEALKVFGVVISDNTNSSFSLIIKGIEKATEKIGYNIILCNSSEDWRQERKSIDMLVQKRVDGIMIVPSQRGQDEPEGRYDILRRSNTPFVLVSRRFEDADCDVVLCDNVRGTQMAIDHLIEKGHKRILHITTDKKISSAGERVDGFKKALAAHGRKARDSDIYYVDDSSRDACTIALSKIMARRKDVTAVTTFNDNMAFCLLRAVLNMGRRVPDDVAIVGFDNNDFGDFSLVPLTTVPQESAFLGSTAVELLMDRITTGRKHSLQRLIVPSGIIARRST